MTEAFPQRIGVGFGIGKKRQTKQASVQNYPTAYPGTEYYVSTSGNDSNNGLSPATAWKTLNKVNVQSFSAGDAILLNSVDTFAGTITVPTSGNSTNPITVSAYGPITSKPVISGFTTVTGFTKRSNTNVYVKHVPTTVDPEILTVNGVQYAQGRTPNANRFSPAYSDYYHIDSHTGTTSITDTECSAAVTNWVGAEIVLRTGNHMNWLRSTIATHSTNTLTFTNTDNLSITDGYGYFIQKDLRTLDQFGEWYFNGTTDSLYFYGNPAGYTIKISTVDKLIDVNTRDYITAKNIKFEGANLSAIATAYSSGASNLTIDYCDFDFNNRSVYGHSAAEMTVTHCNMLRNSFCAVYQHWYSDGSYFANNTIDSTGLVIGAGKGEGAWYNGIGLYANYAKHTNSAKNLIVEYNQVKNSGYMGIIIAGDTAICRYNYVDKYNMIKSDGGAIYYGGQTTFTNVKILNNVVLNGVISDETLGTAINTAAWASYNLYIDYNSSYVTLDGNTSSNSIGAGIMIHMSDHITITNNTVFDCTTGIKFQELTGYSRPVRNITMNNNIVVSKKPAQETLSYRSLLNDFASTGTINYNYYAKPFSIDPVFVLMVNTFTKSAYDFSGYKTATSQDANSVVSTVQIQNDDSVRYYSNPTNAAVVYALNATHVDAKGTTYTGSVTIPAYSSKVLWKNDLTPFTAKKLGVQTVGGSTASFLTRTAVPYTFTEAGEITACNIYLNMNGSSKVNRIKLAVYDNTGTGGKPGNKLAETNIVNVSDIIGWLSVNLKSALAVTNSQTVWLSWIQEKSMSTFYTAGTPGYAWTTGNAWTDGLPSVFGTSTQNNNLFSAHFEYR